MCGTTPSRGVLEATLTCNSCLCQTPPPPQRTHLFLTTHNARPAAPRGIARLLRRPRRNQHCTGTPLPRVLAWRTCLPGPPSLRLYRDAYSTALVLPLTFGCPSTASCLPCGVQADLRAAQQRQKEQLQRKPRTRTCSEPAKLQKCVNMGGSLRARARASVSGAGCAGSQSAAARDTLPGRRADAANVGGNLSVPSPAAWLQSHTKVRTARAPALHWQGVCRSTCT